jgi:selenocysteine lyase/cysteine desulfurase
MVNHSRRNFLSWVGAAGGALALAPTLKAEASEILLSEGTDAIPLVDNDAFWTKVRAGFDLPPGVINLDNGYCNPLSRETMADLVNRSRYIQQLPAKRLEELYANVTSKQLRPGLGRLLGVPADEIAFTRNTTESLDTVILGLPMKAGDEIVCCATDYYAMLDAIEQRRQRDGIVVRMIQPPFPAATPDAITALYEREINRKTRLVLITHASNVTGQIFPVKEIAASAHRVGAEVVVDGAQTMALVDYKIPDLDCDYYGASLHKWLMAPVGGGLLWMRKEHVAKVWPLIPPPVDMRGMARFEWCGTYPEFISSASVPAVKFHERLGSKRKEERMRYLTSYWRRKVEKIPGTRFFANENGSCGIGVFEIANVDAAKLQKELWDRHKILVQHMMGGKRFPQLSGIRVTPNVYTTTLELDRFINALKVSIKT